MCGLVAPIIPLNGPREPFQFLGVWELPEGDLTGECRGAPPTHCCTHCVCSFPSPLPWLQTTSLVLGAGGVLCRAPALSLPAHMEQGCARNLSSIPLISSLEG